MTKSITDELGLPSLQDALKEVAAEIEGHEEENEEVSHMANALQTMNAGALRAHDPTGVDQHVEEADIIYEAAMTAHKDLMDLGFNIEPKHAGANAFMPGLKALEIALKASESKKKSKMDRIRSIMDQEAHKKDMGEGIEDGEIVENSGGSITANRSDIMAKIRNGEI